MNLGLKKPSIGVAVTHELERHPLLIELFQQGLGNVSAIAKYIQPEIEKEIGRKIAVSALGMCIRRHLDGFKKRTKPSSQVPLPIDISTRTGIYEVAVAQSVATHERIAKLRRSLVSKKNDYLSISEGLYEIVISTNQRNKAQLIRQLGKIEKTSERDNLGCVTVNWAAVTKDIPGIYYRVTRALAFKSISIQSFHTIGSEMSIFVNEEVLSEAYRALSELLRGAQSW